MRPQNQTTSKGNYTLCDIECILQKEQRHPCFICTDTVLFTIHRKEVELAILLSLPTLPLSFAHSEASLSTINDFLPH